MTTSELRLGQAFGAVTSPWVPTSASVSPGARHCAMVICVRPSEPCKVGLIIPLRRWTAEVQRGSNSPEAAPFLSSWDGNGNLKVTSLPLEREESTCISDS